MMFRCAARRTTITRLRAGVAQLVEQLIRNQQVLGSSPSAGSRNLNEISRFDALPIASKPVYPLTAPLSVGIATIRAPRPCGALPSLTFASVGGNTDRPSRAI